MTLLLPVVMANVATYLAHLANVGGPVYMHTLYDILYVHTHIHTYMNTHTSGDRLSYTAPSSTHLSAWDRQGWGAGGMEVRVRISHYSLHED